MDLGLCVSAYDPTAQVPPNLRAPSLAALSANSQVIILCLPLEQFEDGLKELRPHLGENHLVLDVGSVKLEPVQTFRQVLGDSVHWVGTHPLFGPTSMARGDRPLRVVICEGSAQAKHRARELWTTLGCEWIEQTSEEHDRAMARSHALAFFLAKGLLEIKAGEGAAFTPPSFEAIGKTITAVRSDAGHLFRSIQNCNPFAAEERGALIEALRHIDEQLAAPEGSSPQERRVDPILEPAPSEEESSLELIAELDRELLALLARRERLATKVSPEELARAEAAMITAAAADGLGQINLTRLFRQA